jgi:cysteine desulfurase/selenocysteine lyase
MTLPALPADFNALDEFPILARWDFYNHAGVAPISTRSAAALAKFTQEARDDAYLTGRWYAQAEVVRKAAARLINATPDEIAFCKNTSEGLAFVANGLDWNAGDEVISTNVEYPSNVYPWMELQRRFGVKHVMVTERAGRIPIESIFAAVTPKTRMIALSSVEYASGYRNDLITIGQFCRAKGILLCVDAIQSCGAVPVDVRAMNIDFLSADGHKWMMAPEGLGIFFCRQELLSQLRPEIGWMNVINSSDYGNYDFTLRADAKRFECGSYNIPGVLAMGAALDLLADISLDTVSARIRALTDQFIAGAAERGYRIFSSRAADEWSGIVSFTSPTHDHAKIVAELEAQKIIIVLREKRLRISPHFYNTAEQIDRLIAALPNHRISVPVPAVPAT